MTDRWMDARTDERTHRKIVLLSHTLTMRGLDVARLIEFRLVAKEKIE